MAVCDLFVWGVEHVGLRFVRVSSYMVRHCLGEKKEKKIEVEELGTLQF